MRTFLRVVLMPGLLTLLAGCAYLHSITQKLEYEEQKQILKYKNQRPIQIRKVTPNENAKLTNSEIIVVASFEFLRGSQPILPRSLRLFIDEVNVTKQSQIVSTQDIPSSLGEIHFEPPHPLCAGKHTAKVQFANDQNQQFSYTWDFYVIKK
jgi:hypothetical protein